MAGCVVRKYKNAAFMLYAKWNNNLIMNELLVQFQRRKDLRICVFIFLCLRPF